MHFASLRVHRNTLLKVDADFSHTALLVMRPLASAAHMLPERAAARLVHFQRATRVSRPSPSQTPMIGTSGTATWHCWGRARFARARTACSPPARLAVLCAASLQQ